MARIYVDTSVILCFYQVADEPLPLLEDLLGRAKYLVLPEQTVREVRRNRDTLLSKLIVQVEEKLRVVPYTTAIVKELPEYAAMLRARDALKVEAQALQRRLRRMLSDRASDLVWTGFEKLLSAPGVKTIPTTDDLIDRAHRRKLLGEPPSSPDKHTIGDELIWESLLAACDDDLIIVSRDHTVADNESVLRREYEGHTGRKLILVTRRLGEALKQIGAGSDKIEERERTLPAMNILDSLCPRCGGGLEETGFDGSDGDEAWWLVCLKCGHEVFPEPASEAAP